MKLLERNSLSRVLFRLTATAILAVTLAAVIVTLSVLYGTFLEENRKDLVVEADHIATGVELGGTEYLNALQPASDLRITWIGADGGVLFESRRYELTSHISVSRVRMWLQHRKPKRVTEQSLCLTFSVMK